MTETVRQWVLGITCAAMIAAVMQTFFPKGGVGKAGRIAVGLLMLLAAIGPLTGLSADTLTQTLDELQEGRAEYEQTLQNSSSELLETVIVRKTQAYISEKAKELGMDCAVEVTCTRTEDGVPCPAAVRITGTLTGGQRARLSALIKEELGILPEDQTYTEEVAEWTPES